MSPNGFVFAAIKRDSVSLFRFPLLSHIPVILYSIFLVCRLKYPSSHFLPFLFSRLFVFCFTLNYFCLNRLISLMGRVFDNGPGDPGSIPGRVIPKTFKMVLDTSLLNTQQYKVRMKGKVE